MKKIIVLALMIISFTACKTTQTKLGEIAKVEGENFKAEKVLSYDQLMAKLQKQEKVEDVIVEGKVTEVCPKKGCWMTVVSNKNEETTPIFVKFKDYGFFMPLDLAGGRVIMKGSALKTITSVEELKHYAAEEGQTKEQIEKITKPIEEYTFVASGVKILKK